MNLDTLKQILKKKELYYKTNQELKKHDQFVRKHYSQQIILFQELQILRLQNNLNANADNYVFNFISRIN